MSEMTDTQRIAHIEASQDRIQDEIHKLTATVRELADSVSKIAALYQQSELVRANEKERSRDTETEVKNISTRISTIEKSALVAKGVIGTIIFFGFIFAVIGNFFAQKVFDMEKELNGLKTEVQILNGKNGKMSLIFGASECNDCAPKPKPPEPDPEPGRPMPLPGDPINTHSINDVDI